MEGKLCVCVVCIIGEVIIARWGGEEEWGRAPKQNYKGLFDCFTSRLVVVAVANSTVVLLQYYVTSNNMWSYVTATVTALWHVMFQWSD
jgi:hypothetical protein